MPPKITIISNFEITGEQSIIYKFKRNFICNLGIFQVDQKLIILSFPVKVPFKIFLDLLSVLLFPILLGLFLNYSIWQYPLRSIQYLMCIVPGGIMKERKDAEFSLGIK